MKTDGALQALDAVPENMAGTSAGDPPSGMGGNGTLSGGLGSDIPTGGNGAYVFLFDSGPLKGQRFVYGVSSGSLYYDNDGRNGAVKVKIATFTNKPALTSADVFVI